MPSRTADRSLFAAALLCALCGCGEPDCPSYLRTEAHDCVDPRAPDSGVATRPEREAPQSTEPDAGSRRQEVGAVAGRSGSSAEPKSDSVADAGRTGGSGTSNGSTAGAAGMSMMPQLDAGVPAANVALCGNGIREGSEVCDGADCKTECTNDNACTPARLEGAAATCDARCVNTEITACSSGDGCCPMGCDYGKDMDCSPSCGDGELTGMETCEPGSTQHPCPTLASCDDHDPCTEDMITGSAQTCSAKCAQMSITRMPVDCDDNNPCTDDTMSESKTSCTYVCMHSTPRRPTGSCVDTDPCTDDTPVVSTTQCSVTCPHARQQPSAADCEDDNPCTDDTPTLSGTRCGYDCPHPLARAGTSCGGGKMCSSAGRCEEPPAVCGDRIVSGAEACDIGARSAGNDGLPSGTVYDRWSCDEHTCKRRYVYTPCTADSQCGPGGKCGTQQGRCSGGVKCQPSDPFTPNDTAADRYNCVLPNGNHGVCLDTDNCLPICVTDNDCPGVDCLAIGTYTLCKIL